MCYNLIMLLVLVQQLLSNNPPCSVITQQQASIYFQHSENQLIIQSNDENFENIRDVGYELLNESFRLSFSQDITIISIFRCNKNFKIKREGKYQILKRVCILAMLNQNQNSSNIYIFGCTLINFQQSIKQFNFNFNNIEQKIQIKSEENEICQNIFEISQEKLILFCLDDSQFKLIEIDIEFKISKVITHSITQQQRICQIKILELSNNLIISFTKCKKWIVYTINENLDVNIQLDQEFYNQNPQFQITTDLVNMQVCQKKIYYIFQNGYTYNFRVRNQDKNFLVGNKTLILNENESLEYIVFQRCNFLYQIVSIEDKIYITDSDQKYYLGTSKIKFSQQNGFLIIISDEQFTLLVTKKIKYTYNIKQTKLNQVQYQILESSKTQQFLYEIDNSEKQVRFLKLEFKNYLNKDYPYQFYYVVPYSNILKNIQCQKIYIISDEKDSHNETNYTTQLKIYNHSVQQHLQFEKYGRVFEHQYEITRQQQLAYNSKINITVYDKFEINEQRQSKYLYEKNTELLYFQLPVIILIKQQQKLFWTTCDDQLLNEINIVNQEVLTTKGYIILNGTQLQDIWVVNSARIYFPFKTLNINGVVDKIDIFSQYLLIYIKYIDNPLILNLNSIMQPQYQPSYLEKELYLNQKIKFYHCDNDIILIQYENQFIIKKEFDTQIFQLLDFTIFLILKEQNVYLVFSVHDQQEIIKLYFISGFELLEIYNYSLDKYVLIRPIKYQILNKNLILLVKKSQNFHLQIFSFQLNDLQLLTDIRTSRQVFFTSENYLIYYNSDDIVEIFDSRNFHIELNFLQKNDKVYFYNLLQIKFNISTKNNLDDIFQCKVDILILFLKFPIITLNQFLTINHISNNNRIIKIPFNPNEYFQGQINDFELFDKQIQIRGPIINDFPLIQCRFSKYNVCKKSKNLIIQNRQFQISEIIENDITINVFSNTINSVIFKLFDDYYLIILEELYQQLGLIIQYNQTSKNYTQTQELFLYNLSNNSKSSIEVIKKQSLCLIQQENQLKTMLYFNGINFSQILLPENILDMCYIESSKVMYLFLYYSLNLTLEFQIKQITNLQILFQQQINQSQIIQNQKLFSNFELNEFITFYKLMSCSQQDHILSIVFIQFTTYYTQIIKYTINDQTLESNFFFEKKLRTIADEQMINYILLDNNFFGIYGNDSVAYYNLSINQEFYDSQFQIRSQIKNIYLYNSTHYYCISNENQYIGRIGFELWFTLDNETDKTNKLIAINDVSKASINIIFSIIQNQTFESSKSWVFLILMTLICLVIIIIYLFTLRRKKLLRNFLQTKIST